eukprot:3982479-Pyramimonas_sp.AAC.1
MAPRQPKRPPRWPEGSPHMAQHKFSEPQKGMLDAPKRVPSGSDGAFPLRLRRSSRAPFAAAAEVRRDAPEASWSAVPNLFGPQERAETAPK